MEIGKRCLLEWKLARESGMSHDARSLDVRCNVAYADNGLLGAGGLGSFCYLSYILLAFGSPAIVFLKGGIMVLFSISLLVYRFALRQAGC